MQVSAIIAEYNPFHNGHLYHISETKKRTDNGFVMVIMSGNFVQRGEPALLDKRLRAKTALMNGADLVVEIPVPWATASAERFARGAVYIAAQSGVVNTLSFGCEDAQSDMLRKIARVTEDKVYSRRIKDYYDAHSCSYPEAKAGVVKSVLGEDCTEIMMKPNNILAIEYMRAIQYFKSDITPLCIERKISTHDGENTDGHLTSAMNIRNMVKTDRDFSSFVPKNTLDIYKKAAADNIFPSLYSRLETAVLADLRRKHPKDFLSVPDVSEGIEYRIAEAAKESVSLNGVFDMVKTKRYTHARIRRIILSSFLGITNEDVQSLPPYIHVLGLNDNGRLILREMKDKFFFPIIMKYSDVARLDDRAKRIFSLESTATDLFNLTLPERRKCGTDMTEEIVYMPQA
ncbi:MAG: nucleotidyltransferase family protein [Clostridiales bacterium]|nr:nucleotidyltransferase family protein [Clostridiales bacterium]